MAFGQQSVVIVDSEKGNVIDIGLVAFSQQNGDGGCSFFFLKVSGVVQCTGAYGQLVHTHTQRTRNSHVYVLAICRTSPLKPNP